MRPNPRSSAAMALLLAVAAGACTSDSAPAPDTEAETEDAGGTEPTIVQPGAPGQPSRILDPDEAAELMEPAPHTEADVAFMQGMILHHMQALRMTRLVPDRSARDDIPLLAERMDVSQEDEIGLMRDWLEARDEEVPDLHAPHDHDAQHGGRMPGMLTEEELHALEEAEGDVFDRLFLESMIAHHEGALVMVDTLFEDGGGLESEAFQLANHMQSDQTIELNRMHEILAEFDGAAG